MAKSPITIGVNAAVAYLAFLATLEGIHYADHVIRYGHLPEFRMNVLWGIEYCERCKTKSA